MDDLFNQIVNISKAGAYDIVSQQVKELQAENKALNEQLENGANQYAYAIVENERLREALTELLEVAFTPHREHQHIFEKAKAALQNK